MRPRSSCVWTTRMRCRWCAVMAEMVTRSGCSLRVVSCGSCRQCRKLCEEVGNMTFKIEGVTWGK